MNQLYFFKAKDFLTIWTTSREISIRQFDSEIAAYEDKYLLANKIVLIIPEGTALNVSDTRLGDSNREVTTYLLNKNGELTRDTHSNPNTIFDKKLNDIKTEIMIHIFKNNHCLQESNEGYHFVTLNEKHTNSFVKISNLLVNKNEIDFLSICLLPYIPNDISTIYVDTSTILSLVYNTLLLKKKLDNSFNIPLVSNFKSYNHIEYLHNINPDESLIIISTSSSRNLVGRIQKETNIKNDIFLTLFYFGDTPTKMDMCNLKKDEILKNKVPKNYTSATCPYCQSGSQPVQIANEQFVTEIQEPEPVRLTQSHQNKNDIDFFTKFTGKEVLQFGGNEENEFNINISNWIILSEVQEHLKYILSITASQMIDKIVYTDDSKELADFIINTMQIKPNHFYNTQEFLNTRDNDDDATKVIMVIAGSVYSGLTLERISRHLRTTNPNSSRVYIVGLLKKHSNMSFDFLRKNLIMHHKYQQFHKFIALDEILLPKFNHNSTWAKELTFLKKIAENESEGMADYNFNPIIHARIQQLDSMKIKPTSTGLFWNQGSTANDALKLQRGFAFLNDEIIKCGPSQADVLYTFASVLQNTRENTKDLKSTPYKHKLLAPNNFTRFNDGILQACLLRLGTQQELNYSSSTHMSKIMSDIIYEVVKDFDQTTGEAAMEFLIALAIEHLKIKHEEKKNLIEKLNTIQGLPEHFKLVIKEIN